MPLSGNALHVLVVFTCSTVFILFGYDQVSPESVLAMPCASQADHSFAVREGCLVRAHRRRIIQDSIRQP
jgi:hypothetical protein